MADEWYYADAASEEQGPISLAELKTLIEAGTLSPSTLVWEPGMGDWLPISHTPALLAGSSAAAPAPGAVAPAYGQPYTQRLPAPGTANASMILGILGITCFWILTAIPAIICGHMALNQIKASGDLMDGRGPAIAGLVMGYIVLGMTALYVVFAVIMVGAGAMGSM